MINYNTFTLDNGLQVVINKDVSTPLVAVNLLYKAGAKHENEDMTGLAHLFEHLMFGGSERFPVYDAVVENMCGESNAFTNNDFTNYYLVVPTPYLSKALEIEADRMRNLILTQQKLDIQKNVVIEEFKQRYLNQPYGDLWQKIRVLTYEKHPYKWQTIGKDISHIEQVTLQQANDFYNRFYAPSNAILTISGNVEQNTIKEFEKLTASSNSLTSLSPLKEPQWQTGKSLTAKADVPVSVIVLAFQMCNRTDKDYYVYDLLSDLFSSGKSSRLYNALVVNKRLFTEINACITGDDDEGLFIIVGKYQDNVTIEQGEEAIWDELHSFTQSDIDDKELQKVKNKNEANHTFSNMKALDKAMNLAYFAHLGDVELINREMDLYNAVTASQIRALADRMFNNSPCRTLYYLAQ
ncbi:MAG: insulinase family protein [Bacteroidales bacterium]|jgi:predicted Zn-dependent peptidase|nr:insulinase family protein [Bacteroidales bacterium]